MATTQYIGARYVPLFFTNPDDNSNNWKSGVAYDPLTVVTDLNQSYTSKIPVPASVGRPSENPTYWIMTGAYNAQVEQYRQEVQQIREDVNDIETNVETRLQAFQTEIDTDFNDFTQSIRGMNYSFNGSKIVSHAGGGNLLPNNTIQGVNLAIALEADAIEIDCQITSDHVPVCAHEPTVNGTVLKNTPYSQVSEISVATAGAHHMGCTIPSLESVALACKMAQKTLLLEFKWEAENHMTVDDLPYVKNLLDKVGIDDVVFISWISDPLTAYKEIDSSARCIWLLGDPTPVTTDNIAECKRLGFYGVGIPVSTDGTMIDYAHSIGLAVDSFTLDAWDSRTYTCLQHGSDYITTNDILSCGCFAYPKYDRRFIATAPSVQGVPMISKFFSTVNDPSYPYFVETVSRTNTNLTGISRLSASVTGSRAASMPLAVKPGDVIKYVSVGTYDLSVEVYNTYLSTWVANSGWLSADYTIPANGYMAILNYRRKDDGKLSFWELPGMHSQFAGITRS